MLGKILWFDKLTTNGLMPFGLSLLKASGYFITDEVF
jgi:hypothetical protein